MKKNQGSEMLAELLKAIYNLYMTVLELEPESSDYKAVSTKTSFFHLFLPLSHGSHKPTTEMINDKKRFF